MKLKKLANPNLKLLNTEKEDYHVHSLNYSDGLNTIDELTLYAGKFGMKKIVITDHSQATIDKYNLAFKGFRGTAKRWKNVINKVEVSFGVEADILDEDGNVCFQIDGRESDFTILSLHPDIFKGKFETVTDAIVKAITKHHEKINLIGHLYLEKYVNHIDMKKVVETANRYNIPVELNCKYLKDMLNNDTKIKEMLMFANQIIVTSDAHTLYELKELRKIGFKYLKDNNFI